jgi:hypothetical protein
MVILSIANDPVLSISSSFFPSSLILFSTKDVNPTSPKDFQTNALKVPGHGK